MTTESNRSQKKNFVVSVCTNRIPHIPELQFIETVFLKRCHRQIRVTAIVFTDIISEEKVKRYSTKYMP